MEPLIINITSGDSHEDVIKLTEQIKQANKDDRTVIFNIDSPGTCGSINDYRLNLNDFKPAIKEEAKVVNFSEYGQKKKFIKFIVENSKSFKQ